MTDASGAVGLVLAQSARLLSTEPFYHEFMAGAEEKLAERRLSIRVREVPSQAAEVEVYRRWADWRLVDAVFVVNLAEGDQRPTLLRELHLPCLLIGLWGEPGFATIGSDNAGAEREALAHLFELGHRRIARVTGPARLDHTQARTAAMLEECRAIGAEPIVVEGDYSDEAGTQLTRQLLALTQPPTAIVYDNDVMAIAGLRAAKYLGVRVPEQLSLVAWDDSTLCEMSSPPMTAMRVDVHEYGVRAAQSILEILDGLPVTERWAPAAQLVPRGTTARAASSV